MKDMNILNLVSWILVLVGGVNWGLYGLFKLNLVEAILGSGFLARLVYIIVGAAACYIIYTHFSKKQSV
jgi:uncharacterized protein